jgi:hypothetical protein
MSTLRNRIETLQTKTTSTAVLNACNEAIRRIDSNNAYAISAEENSVLEADILNTLIEGLSKIEDESAKQFISMNVIEKRIENLNNLGVKKTFAVIGESEISKHPAFSYMFEKLKAVTAQPEWMIIESVIASLTPFNWDPTVNECLKSLTENSEKFREEITIYKIVENIKRSTSNYLMPAMSAQLDEYLNNRNSSSRVKLMEKASQFLFDPNVKNLHKFLSESERAFHIAASDTSCNINRVYSPVFIAESSEFFLAGSQVYKKEGNSIAIASSDEITALPESFKAVADILTWDNVIVAEGLIKLYSGDKVIEISESQVKINGKVVNKEDIHKVYLNAGVFRMTESKNINAIFAISENWNNIFEMDFAKTITSKSDAGKSMTLFFLGENIFINKSNKLMNESVFYTDCNATQTKNLVMEFMKTDISSTFAELLNEEEKELKKMSTLKEEFVQSIAHLTEQRSKLENLPDGMSEEAEVKDLISAIDEEINFLKSEYAKLANAETAATTVSEGLGFNVGDTATLGKKK